MIYLFVIILLLISIIQHDINGKPYGKFLANFYPILFALIAGLSYRMGVDCIRYENSYESLAFSNLEFDPLAQEPGYLVFVCLCKSISLPWFVAHTIVCLFVNISVSVFFQKYSKQSYFTCLLIYAFLFYYLFNFEILRQSIAMSIILLYLSKNDIRFSTKYFANVLIAFTFHYVAISALSLPLLLRIKWNWKRLLTTFIIIIIIGNIIALKFGDFLALLELLYSGLGRYNEMYSDSETYTSRLNLFGQIQIIFLQIIPFFIPLIFFLQKKIGNNVLCAITIFYGLLVLLGTYVSILSRISYLFSIPAVSLLSNYMIRFRLNSNIIPRCIVGMMFIMNVYVFYNQEDGYDFKNIQKLQPYSSVIDKEYIPERESWIDRIVYSKY